MEKTKEIALIKQLVNADTYFSQKFSQCIDTMVNNINNDFDLLCGTCYDNSEITAELEKATHNNVVKDTQIAKLQECLTTVQKRLDGRDNMIRDLLDYLVAMREGGTDVYPQRFFSSNDILKSKIRLGIPLDAEEKEIIFNLM